MNGKRTHFLLAGLALSLFLAPIANAEDAKPAIDETKSHDRGVMFVPMGSPGAGAAPAISVPTVTKPEVKTAIQQVTRPKVATPVVKAVAKTTTKPANVVAKVKKVAPSAVAKVNNQSKTQTAISNGSKEDNNAVTATTALVNFGGDGPVVTAKLDHTGASPKYKVGDKMVINVKAHQDCNVVIFNYDSTGTLTQIFPNDYQQNGYVKAGDSVEIGGNNSDFDYQIAGQGGAEKIFVYAYPSGVEKPQAIQTIAMNPIHGTPFRSTEMTVDQYRKMVNECGNYTTRAVNVVAKKRAHQLISSTNTPNTNSTANKIELSFVVEK